MAAITPRRILIIDDNVSLAENIAEILEIDRESREIARGLVTARAANAVTA